MRYAIVSDIHGNLQAWRAVMKDLRAQQVDGILCLGDVVGYGPNPAEVLEAVRHDVPDILIGNHDAVVAGLFDAAAFQDSSRRMIEWTTQQLGAESKAFCADLPYTLIGDGFLCSHGDFSDPAAFVYLDEETVDRSWPVTTEQFLFVGHTHIPAVHILHPDGGFSSRPATDFQMEPGSRYAINVGSVGMPRDGDLRASYCIYDWDTGTVWFRRAPFNVNAFRRAVRQRIPKETADYVIQLYGEEESAPHRLEDFSAAPSSPRQRPPRRKSRRLTMSSKNRGKRAPTATLPAPAKQSKTPAAVGIMAAVLLLAGLGVVAAMVLWRPPRRRQTPLPAAVRKQPARHPGPTARPPPPPNPGPRANPPPDPDPTPKPDPDPEPQPGREPKPLVLVASVTAVDRWADRMTFKLKEVIEGDFELETFPLKGKGESHKEFKIGGVYRLEMETFGGRIKFKGATLVDGLPVAFPPLEEPESWPVALQQKNSVLLDPQPGEDRPPDGVVVGTLSGEPIGLLEPKAGTNYHKSFVVYQFETPPVSGKYDVWVLLPGNTRYAGIMRFRVNKVALTETAVVLAAPKNEKDQPRWQKLGCLTIPATTKQVHVVTVAHPRDQSRAIALKTVLVKQPNAAAPRRTALKLVAEVTDIERRTGEVTFRVASVSAGKFERETFTLTGDEEFRRPFKERAYYVLELQAAGDDLQLDNSTLQRTAPKVASVLSVCVKGPTRGRKWPVNPKAGECVLLDPKYGVDRLAGETIFGKPTGKIMTSRKRMGQSMQDSVEVSYQLKDMPPEATYYCWVLMPPNATTTTVQFHFGEGDAKVAVVKRTFKHPGDAVQWLKCRQPVKLPAGIQQIRVTTTAVTEGFPDGVAAKVILQKTK